jgi:Uncharacterized low-complexity proteins
MTQTTTAEGGEAHAKASEILSLEQHLEQSGPFHWKSCMMLFHDVCVDLEGIHNRSGCLGDITIRSFELVEGDTPRNTRIRFKETGAAAAASAKRFSFPDAAYYSPEKCLKRELDARSDIYSLGCVIYECLTGSPPFVNRNDEILKEMHVSDEPLPPGRRTQQIVIPDEVDELILKALKQDPQKRQQTAGELRADLGIAVQQDVDDVPAKGLQRIATPRKIENSRTMFIVAICALVASLSILAIEQFILSTESYKEMVAKTEKKLRHHYLMGVEYGGEYLKQLEFGELRQTPAKGESVIEITQAGGDVVLFATSKRATLKEAVQEAYRRGLMLWKADFKDADLSSMKLPEIRLQAALLEGTNFSGTDLTKANLIESSAVKANFQNANLTDSVAMRSNFAGANFSGANLTKVHCLSANFAEANFTNANLDFADFSGANFDRADLTGASLNGTRVTREFLKTAKITPEQLAKTVEVPMDAVRQLDVQRN